MKRRRLRNILSKGHADMVFIQETKTTTMTNSFVSSLWGSEDVEWMTKDSMGASGGIITVWNKNVITPLFIFRT